MKNRDMIVKYFEELPQGTIVCANRLYRERFGKMSEQAFFKAVERLTKEGILTRHAKGMYSLKRDDDAEDVLNHFFGEDNSSGMYIGYRLYNKYGISSYLPKDIELYSNVIDKAGSNIGNLHVKRIDIELTYENTRVIEALEIMQNYDDIVELNKQKFARFAKQFAKGYDDGAAVYVISHVKYKKRTIAFMKKVLDMYKVPNTLGQFLSAASKYKVPPVQRIAR